MSSKIWLITGAATGIGFATAESALARGDAVVGTVNRNRSERIETLAARYPDKLHIVTADVSKKEDVARLFEYVQKEFGRLDVISNNAAIGGPRSEAESFPEGAARRVFDVNFWGALYVAKEAVRFFREVNPPGEGGRLLQISSVAGILSPPLMGIYAASKHALEALSESLAAEILPEWNIKISIVELGGFSTEGAQNLIDTPRLPPPAAYTDENGAPKTKDMLADMTSQLSSPAKAGEALWRLSREPEPPLRLPLGKDAIVFMKMWTEQFIKSIDDNTSWSEDL